MDKPICKECAYFWRDKRRCVRPVGEAFDPVFGAQTIGLNVDAGKERQGARTWLTNRAKCGPDGAFFKTSKRGPFDTPPPQRGG